MTATLEQLQAAGVELDKLMGITPAFNPESTEEEAIAWLTNAITFIAPTDRFTPKTQTVIDELKSEPAEEVEEVKEEAEASPLLEIEVDPDDVDLKNEIIAAARLRDLKDIATEYDEFKPIRGKLSSYKNVDELKKQMVEILAAPLTPSGRKQVPIPEKKEKKTPVLKPEPEETPEDVPEPVVKKKKPSIQRFDKDEPRTEYGHVIASQAGVIDTYLLSNKGKAIEIDAVATACKVSTARVKSHLSHLMKDKNVPLELKKKEGTKASTVLLPK